VGPSPVNGGTELLGLLTDRDIIAQIPPRGVRRPRLRSLVSCCRMLNLSASPTWHVYPGNPGSLQQIGDGKKPWIVSNSRATTITVGDL
jgi:hypothetical protein